MDKKDFIGKTTSIVIKGLEVVSDQEDVIVIGGYANRFIDDSGELVVDRSNEAILPEAYDIKSFMKNPILLYQHDQHSPVGKIINIDIRPEGLYIEAEVHKIMNEKVFYAVKNGILRTFSVGFLVRDVKEIDDIYFWTDVELLEVSIVGVPDNQESTFSVLTDSVCGSGVCLLASKAIPKELLERHKKAIKNDTVSDKPWSSINKSELKQQLEENGDPSYIKEAFLVVRDPEKRSTWKFPHHEYTNGDLVLNKGGVVSAYAALKGARNEPNISTAEKRDAAKHLLKHYKTLKEKGMIEEIPEDLIQMSKEFEEVYLKELEELDDVVIEAKTKDVEDEVEASENQETEQPENKDTINGEETKDEGGDEPQDASDENNSSEAEEGESAPSASNGESDTPEVNSELVKRYIDEAKSSTEGLNELLELYMTIETVLNEALKEQLEQ